MNVNNSMYNPYNYGYANQNSATVNTTSSVPNFADMLKTQDTQKVQEVRQTQNTVEKKDYSSMTLEELDNLTYEEYQIYGEEIRKNSSEAYFQNSSLIGTSAYNENINDLTSSIRSKVLFSNYTNDENLNKALYDSYLKSDDKDSFELYVMFGLDDAVNGTTAKIGELPMNYTKEQRTNILTNGGTEQLVSFYQTLLENGEDEFGMELSQHIQHGHEIWKTILEVLNTNKNKESSYA